CISSSCGMVSKDLLRSASTTSVWPCRSRTITAWIASVALRFGRVIRVAQDVRSPDLVVEQIEPEVRLPLRLAIEFPLQSPDRIWRLQAHRQSPHLVCFENAPEVRDLPSTRVTRLPRYDDPVRLPRGPAPCSAVEAATPVQHGSPPLTRSPVSTCCSHYPGGPVRVRLSAPSPSFGWVGVHNFPFEACSGFTRITARRFARPPKAAFVAGLRPGRLPDKVACQLPGRRRTKSEQTKAPDEGIQFGASSATLRNEVSSYFQPATQLHEKSCE